MSTSLSNLVRAEGRSLSPSELLSRPVTILQGVSELAKDGLKQIDVLTVFDLATSSIFYQARRIAEAVEGHNEITAYGKVPADLLDQPGQTVPLAELPEKDIEQLKTIGPETAAALKASLSLTTLRDLALWPPYRAAQSILNEVYGLSLTPTSDPETPQELVPQMGRLPTEQVQYEVVLFDRILDGKVNAGMPSDPSHEGGGGLSHLPRAIDALLGLEAVPDSPYTPIENAGQLDLSLTTGDSGYPQPALGAVVTLTQSWYTHGLSLGQLLHTIALAPGESTRIAMIDWSRASRAATGEEISESEALASDLSRSRAISEVTNVVANESQSGWSTSKNVSRGAGVGLGGGVAGIGQAVAGALGISAGFSWSEGFASSNAYSEGHRDLSAAMTQNVLDSTHQASNLARNRRATIVREVSQKESEQISTRALTNYNHMHALSIQYYEVVQLFKVVVELSRITPCLFIPMKVSAFDSRLARRFRSVLAAVGLTPQVRALATIEPDHVAVAAPHRSKPWPVSSLQQLAALTGENAGSANSAEIALPKGFAANIYFGFWNVAPIDQAIVTLKTGASSSFDVIPAWQQLNLSLAASGANPFDPSLGRVTTAGTPAVTPEVLLPDGDAHIYVRGNDTGTDNQLIEFYKTPSANWQVYNLSKVPGGVEIAGDPAVLLAGSVLHVYVRGIDNRLREFYKTPSADWQVFNPSQRAGDVEIAGDPAVTPAILLPGGGVHIYVRGNDTGIDNQLLEFYKTPSADWQVFNLSKVPGGFKIAGDPAVLLTGSDLHVYVRGIDNQLLEFYKTPSADWQVINLSDRVGGVKITGDPAVLLTGRDVHIYVRGIDNRLREFYKTPSADWQVSYLLGGYEVMGDPVALITGNDVHVYVMGGMGRLLEFYRRPSGTWKVFDLSAISDARWPINYRPAVQLAGDDIHLYSVDANNQLLRFSTKPPQPWYPKYVALTGDYFSRETMKGHDFSEITRIEFVKKPGSEEYEGEMDCGVSFIGNVPRQQGAPWATLNATIKVPRASKRFTVFEFSESIVDDDLIRHLNDNSLYYSQAIWRSLDSATLGLLLSTYSFGGRPLIEMIDPTPISIAANYLAFRFYGAEQSGWWTKFLKDKGVTLRERRESLIPMPSGGVFAEAVLGRFNSAEKLDITRFWNWQDSPIPLTAPEISAISAGSRAQTDDLKPGQLGPSVLNVLNPPAIPDPQGLSAAINAIARGNMFRDMSGLAATIAAAQAGMRTGVAGATEFGRQAAQNAATAAQLLSNIPGGGAGSGMGGAGGPTSPPTISNAGARINHGADLDRRGVTTRNGQQYNGQFVPMDADTAYYEGKFAGANSGELAAFYSDVGGSGSLPHQYASYPGSAGGQIGGPGETAPDDSKYGLQAEIEWERANPEGHVEWVPTIEGPAGIRLWNFAVGSEDIKKFEADLWKRIEILKDWANRGDSLLVTGHTSPSGSDSRNQYISAARALRVKRWLVDQAGFPEERVHTSGLSDTQPLPSYRLFDYASHARERRVEIRDIREQWSTANYDRALAIFLAQPDSSFKKRMLKIIPLLKDPSKDDRFVTKSGVNTASWFIDKPNYEWLMDPDAWDKRSPKVAGHFRAFELILHPNSPDSDYIGHFRSLDVLITEGLEWIKEMMMRHESATNDFIQLVNKWVKERQTKEELNSIYYYYGDGQP